MIAIGNPLGMLEGSVTAGIVSAQGADGPLDRRGKPVLPGLHPDGRLDQPRQQRRPLVDERGDAIGVNTAYNAPGNGIGFAISINMVRDGRGAVDPRPGAFRRAILGVNLDDPRRDMADGWGLDGRPAEWS